MKIFSRLLLASTCVVALLGFAAASPPPAGDQVRIAWHRPAKGSQFDSSSTVNQNITYLLNTTLRRMLGHKADPIYVIEDRTRTFAMPLGASDVYIDDVFARHHGGPHNSDTTVKRRARKQIIAFDPSGRYGYEPVLCMNEPPLDDAHANPTAFKKCPTTDPPGNQRFEDPGDAALSELPAGPIEPGRSWAFSRKVVVGREEGSGTMNYVDTMQRIEERGKHRVAVIDVSATGRIDAAKDLQARGFHTATMTFTGAAEFDLDQGTPGTQHYTGHVEWHASIMGFNIGYAYDETYDGKPWAISRKT